MATFKVEVSETGYTIAIEVSDANGDAPVDYAQIEACYQRFLESRTLIESHRWQVQIYQAQAEKEARDRFSKANGETNEAESLES
jgi:hypothetical protein